MLNLRLGYASLIMATLFWGGNFVLGKVLSDVIPPITLTYLRWLPAFLILFFPLLSSDDSGLFTGKIILLGNA